MYAASNAPIPSGSRADAQGDPIAQLLSQLSDVRRLNNQSSAALGASSQNAIDRHSLTARLPTQRLLRRNQGQQQSSSISSSQYASYLQQLVDFDSYSGLSTAAGGSGASASSNAANSPYLVLMDSIASGGNPRAAQVLARHQQQLPPSVAAPGGGGGPSTSQSTNNKNEVNKTKNRYLLSR